jgi:hypothetical protein
MSLGVPRGLLLRKLCWPGWAFRRPAGASRLCHPVKAGARGHAKRRSTGALQTLRAVVARQAAVRRLEGRVIEHGFEAN